MAGKSKAVSIAGRALKWGSLAAIACLLTVASASAVWGSLFGRRAGAAIYGGNAPPGMGAAYAMALFSTIFLGVPLAVVLLFVGAVVGAVRAIGQADSGDF